MSDNSIESVLSMISRNPELINKISSAVQAGGDDLSKNLSNVISLINESQSKNEIKETTKENEQIYENSDTPSSNFSKLGEILQGDGANSFLLSLSKSISKNSPFLLALKPYLSKGRCDMIDTAVKISQLANIINLAK